MMLELKLTDKVTNPEIDHTETIQQPRKSMYAIDHFRNVLLFVQVYKLESEELRKADLFQESKE